MNEMLEKLGQNAKDAEIVLRNLSTNDKNKTLEAVAKALVAHTDEILKANALDVENGKKNQMPEGLIDRLMLTPERIEGMADGLRQLTGLEDPIGEVTGMKKRPNGLLIGQKRVPLGVIGIIYESRPNVTIDAAALCIKSGNATILRGGSEALHSNQALAKIVQAGLAHAGLPESAVQVVNTPDRAAVGDRVDGAQAQAVQLAAAGVGHCHVAAGGIHLPPHQLPGIDADCQVGQAGQVGRRLHHQF